MEKKYTFWQHLYAAFLNTNATWLYATEAEKLLMGYDSLTKEEREIVIAKLSPTEEDIEKELENVNPSHAGYVVHGIHLVKNYMKNI